MNFDFDDLADDITRVIKVLGIGFGFGLVVGFIGGCAVGVVV